MNIGIFVPNISNFGIKGFYNSQEIGLAKELLTYGHNIVVFKLISGIETINYEYLSSGCTLISLPARNIGTNGLIFDFSILKKMGIKKLVCFSDTQIIVPSLFKYCQSNGIDFIPYIGVIESNSKNKVIKRIMDIYSKKNRKIYKKCKTVIGKTPEVIEELKRKGISNALLGPVGLDGDLMNKSFKKVNHLSLKQNLGFREEDIIILFVGRLEEEKNPVQAIEILKELVKQNNNYKLVMIGNGSQYKKINKEITKDIKDNIVNIYKVSNDEMWKYYSISKCFINLNEHEIFGMALLEAMYYECPVIAVKAPGPNYIIQDNKTGILINGLNKKEFVDTILDKKNRLQNIKVNLGEYSKENFTWNKCARKVLGKDKNEKK